MTIEEKIEQYEQAFGDPAFAEVIPDFGLKFTEDQMKYLRWITCKDKNKEGDFAIEAWIKRLSNYEIYLGFNQGKIEIAMSHPDNLSDEQAYDMLDDARKFVVKRHDIYKNYPLENKDETV
jgi:hypothetical protein